MISTLFCTLILFCSACDLFGLFLECTKVPPGGYVETGHPGIALRSVAQFLHSLLTASFSLGGIY